MSDEQIPGQMTLDECIELAEGKDPWVGRTGVAPCFVPCGQPACRTLGCIRVYNAEYRDSAA